ncbi:MAG: hypothetical protein LBR07_03480 [Puniceicoccales bacterium]|jgi:hypothetical protein|nr:hypothetical protein [Puniceicoccales bacterium]
MTRSPSAPTHPTSPSKTPRALKGLKTALATFALAAFSAAAGATALSAGNTAAAASECAGGVCSLAPDAVLPATGDALFDTFRAPPVSAKPFVRWWWNGDKLDAKEILRELDVMRANGIGGVEINPIAFPRGGDDLGIPSLTWLSPEWIEMVRVALKGAAERGIVCDMIVGSGWPFGTETLQGAERSQILSRAGRKLRGPTTVEIKVADLVKDAAPRPGHGYDGRTSRLYSLTLAPAELDKLVPPQNIAFSPSAKTVKVNVPEGDFILSALVEYTGFMSVINGAPGAAGPVLNHYYEPAALRFLNRLSDNLFPKIKDIKPSFRGLFCDSMELEGSNWSPDFAEEFKKRRGYDITPYLPYIIKKSGHMGHRTSGIECKLTGDAKDEAARANYDFTITCMEIITDRFLKVYTKWCNAHGYKSRVQTYGNEFHPLEGSLNVDIPECETWVAHGPWGDTMVNKFVASAARYTGKNIVSCEEITNTNRVFNTTLEQVKIIGDESNLSGVTHSILHGYNYSPLAVPFPGWVRYGTFFNERNTWWPWFKKWAEYKTRLSALLQNTTPFADIAVMHPLADLWTIHGPQRDPFPRLAYPKYVHRVWRGIHMNGAACDYTSERILQDSDTAGGELKYGPRKYKTLILVEVETMAPATAEKIAAFVRAGGKLILVAKTPHKAPGLVDYKQNNTRVAAIFDALKRDCAKNVFIVPACGDDHVAWFANVMRATGIEPYVALDKTSPEVSQIRQRAADGKDIFFFSNKSTANRHLINARFTQTKGIPWEWDAETGRRFVLTPNADGSLLLDLPPATSKIIVFDKHANGPKLPARPAENPTPAPLPDKWQITLKYINGKITGTDISGLYEGGKTLRRHASPLFDISRDKETADFAGAVFYEQTLPATATAGKNYLDLGRVAGISEVWLDDKKLGEHWYGRHIYRLPANATAGATAGAGNTAGKPLKLKIKITTTLGNLFRNNPDYPVGRRWAGRTPTPVGLFGPVTLR